MLRYFVPDENGEPVPCPMPDWARWLDRHDNHVAEDWIETGTGPAIRVSTVFLGLDHRHGDDGPPILWETMVFGGRHDQYQERYTSRAEALAGHRLAVERVRGT